MKQWREENKEHRQEYQRQWRAKNKEHCNEYNKQWREENPDYYRLWLANNPKYQTGRKRGRAAYYREYRRQNPRKVALYSATKRSRAKGLMADLTEEQWEVIKNVFKQKCVYCGKRTRRLTKDHVIPLSKGGALTLTNIVPACQSCNSKKATGAPLSPLQALFL